MGTVNAIPEGFHSITPHLIVPRSAADYIDFLKRAFGAVELDRAIGPSGKILHATVQIGDSRIMLNDHFPERTPAIAQGYWPFLLNLYVTDADAVWEKALAAGCQVRFPLKDQFWGDRYGQAIDPFGFTWAISTRKENLSREEMERRQQEFFARREHA